MRISYFRILTLVALFCVVCGLTGCKPEKSAETGSDQPTAPDGAKVEPEGVKPVTPDTAVVTAKPPAPAPTGVLVTVNGTEITSEQLDEMLKPHLARMAKQAASMPPQFLEQQKQTLRKQALPQMIRIQLLDEEIKKAGITVSDQEIDDEMAKMASQQKPPVPVEQFKKVMESYGYDFDQWKKQVSTILGHQKLIASKFPDEMKVTEEDAKTFFEQNKARYGKPEQVRASHILIKAEPTDPNEVKALARAKAEDLLKQVKEGADFAALAKEHSEGPSAKDGGDLNYFNKGAMVPPFDKVAFELEVGKISEVVETRFGFHIIKVTDHREASATPFEQVKENIINEQTQRKLRDLLTKYTESLEANAKIDYAPGVEFKPVAPPGGGAPPR